MSKAYITYNEYPMNVKTYDGYYHSFIIHKNWEWHFGRFPSIETLNTFCEFAGIEYKLTEERKRPESQGGIFRKYELNVDINDYHSFKSLEELPEQVKKNSFIGLSNGSLVTCYLYNDGNVLHVYRPNPNYKDVYKPLSLEEHISFCRLYGYC